jgi:hypothetical protein
MGEESARRGGSSGDGMSGDGMSGDGMSGDGMSGDGMSGDGMSDEQVRARLIGYRDATAALDVPAAVLTRLEQGVPRRAHLRGFVRDARTGLLLAALVGGGSRWWAHVEERRVEHDLYVQVGAWVEAP